MRVLIDHEHRIIAITYNVIPSTPEGIKDRERYLTLSRRFYNGNTLPDEEFKEFGVLGQKEVLVTSEIERVEIIFTRQSLSYEEKPNEYQNVVIVSGELYNVINERISSLNASLAATTLPLKVITEGEADELAF